MKSVIFKATNQHETAEIFDKHGTPAKVTSSIGSYVPYENDKENDVFDEAMNMLCMGATSIALIYYA